jgi:hypothetical protein
LNSGIETRDYIQTKVASTGTVAVEPWNGKTTGAIAFLGSLPNPSSGGVGLKFAAGDCDEISVSVSDVSGRLIRHWSHVRVDSQGTILRWNGEDIDGHRVRSGIYFVTVSGSCGQAGGKILMFR